ncbi:CGNR zinc finger domain-containing protein [Nocardia sp. GAS34]|uniref:CGNR zinc finger domain-containing protein n=1 Tax=unclassified Nocardia TaxID=2637762 RepID=UPI003D250D48
MITENCSGTRETDSTSRPARHGIPRLPRRWCSSATCGNRERVRALRATREQ